jgi:effector-binding domain-containing protein
MKILKRIIIWLVVLIALLIGVAYLLPANYHVERSLLINGDKDIIYSMVCDFENWNYWTPWAPETDPTLNEEFIGNCEVGAIHRWVDKKMGHVEMMITHLDPYKKINWELGLKNQSEKMIIGMLFESEAGGYVLTWTADGNLGYNPFYRYYGLMIDTKLGSDYEKGLMRLKEVCEALPDYPGIQVVEVASLPAISITDSVSATTYGPFMEESMGNLYMYALRNEAQFKGHAYTAYHHWDPPEHIVIEVGIPLASPIKGEGVIKAVQSPGGKAVRATHWGAYEKIGPAHEALQQYIDVLDLELIGTPWESYITNPTQEPDTARWETIVYYPIK